MDLRKRIEDLEALVGRQHKGCSHCRNGRGMMIMGTESQVAEKKNAPGYPWTYDAASGKQRCKFCGQLSDAGGMVFVFTRSHATGDAHGDGSQATA